MDELRDKNQLKTIFLALGLEKNWEMSTWFMNFRWLTYSDSNSCCHVLCTRLVSSYTVQKKIPGKSSCQVDSYRLQLWNHFKFKRKLQSIQAKSPLSRLWVYSANDMRVSWYQETRKISFSTRNWFLDFVEVRLTNRYSLKTPNRIVIGLIMKLINLNFSAWKYSTTW